MDLKEILRQYSRVSQPTQERVHAFAVDVSANVVSADPVVNAGLQQLTEDLLQGTWKDNAEGGCASAKHHTERVAEDLEDIVYAALEKAQGEDSEESPRDVVLRLVADDLENIIKVMVDNIGRVNCADPERIEIEDALAAGLASGGYTVARNDSQPVPTQQLEQP